MKLILRCWCKDTSFQDAYAVVEVSKTYLEKHHHTYLSVLTAFHQGSTDWSFRFKEFQAKFYHQADIQKQLLDDLTAQQHIFNLEGEQGWTLVDNIKAVEATEIEALFDTRRLTLLNQPGVGCGLVWSCHPAEGEHRIDTEVANISDILREMRKLTSKT